MRNTILGLSFVVKSTPLDTNQAVPTSTEDFLLLIWLTAVLTLILRAEVVHKIKLRFMFCHKHFVKMLLLIVARQACWFYDPWGANK